ncbi:MAG: D-glycero-beta-D-manno-heptose 1-phosphate adenylyltransferase, partial [Candidatus Omnitrophota bacterium]
SKHKKVVFTNGCFDLLHRGHIDYLRKARSLGDCLVIGVNSDASVRRLKGAERPITAQADRAEILASLEFVTYVTIFNEDTPLQLITALRPDVIVKGGDWDPRSIIGGDFVRSYGGRVAVIKYRAGYSTTGILKKVARA